MTQKLKLQKRTYLLSVIGQGKAQALLDDHKHGRSVTIEGKLARLISVRVVAMGVAPSMLVEFKWI